jgi:hypothetical protein
MSNYIIVLPVGVLDSATRAKQITRELYNITVPLAVQADYQKDGQVFGIVTHPDGVQCALQVDPGYIIPVHPQANLEKLVSMFPDLTDTERVTLQGYIHTQDKFPFGAIIPSTTTLRDYDYMVENGWFPQDDEI